MVIHRNIFVKACLILFITTQLFVISCSFNSAHAKSILKLAAIGHSSDSRQAFYSMAYEFERQNPEVEIQFIIKHDAEFKNDLTNMLQENSGVDIVIWHSGERLKHFVSQDQILPITDVWDENKLNSQFTNFMKQMVSVNDEIYAIPISYYQWGLYYNKALFTRLGISPPQNWQQFLSILSTIKQHNIIPIYIGSKNPWPVGCWFEYLNLRLNGLEYHNDFVQGNVSAHAQGIKQVLLHWKKLIDEENFFQGHSGKNLTDGFPLIFRDQAAMMLTGRLIESYESVSQEIINNIGFFPFPRIKSDIEDIQVTPLEVMFINNFSSQPALAKKFLLMAADKNIQGQINRQLRQFPVNKHAKEPSIRFLQDIMKSLKQAQGYTHFYDREVEKQYGQENLKTWLDFLDNPDVEATVLKMEQSRLRYLARKSLSAAN